MIRRSVSRRVTSVMLSSIVSKGIDCHDCHGLAASPTAWAPDIPPVDPPIPLSASRRPASGPPQPKSRCRALAEQIHPCCQRNPTFSIRGSWQTSVSAPKSPGCVVTVVTMVVDSPSRIRAVSGVRADCQHHPCGCMGQRPSLIASDSGNASARSVSRQSSARTVPMPVTITSLPHAVAARLGAPMNP